MKKASGPLTDTAKRLEQAVELAQEAVIESASIQNKMSGTLKGALEQLRDTATAATNTFKTHEDRYGGVNESLGQAISGFQRGIEEVAKGVSKVLAEQDKHLAGALGNLQSVIEELSDAIPKKPRHQA